MKPSKGDHILDHMESHNKWKKNRLLSRILLGIMEYPKKRGNEARELVTGIFIVPFSTQNGRDMWYIEGWHSNSSLAFWG